MKIEEIDEFKPMSTDIMYSCMEYVIDDAEGNDVMFVGTSCGRIHSFLIYRRKLPRSLRPEDLSRDVQHNGSVTCLLYSKNTDLSASSIGIVVSGSSDRTIKIWCPNGAKPLCIQTLYGHEGTVTKVADGHDGTLLSCSVDGCLRLWKPQRGRKLMLHSFLECTFVMKQKNAWLSALAVSHINSWACYVGNMDGTIEIYRKGSELNEAEYRTAVFTGQLTKHKRWENVHALGISLLHIVFEESFLITLSYDHTAKILDLHLGSTLHVINNCHNCKYTGLVWDSPNFQLYLSDEKGHLEVWSSFYERRIENIVMTSWKPPKREATSNLSGGHTGLSLAQLQTLSLSGPIQAFKQPSCLISLLPRTGVVKLFQVTAEQATAEFIGHAGMMVLGLSVLPSPEHVAVDADDEKEASMRRYHSRHVSNHQPDQLPISKEESTFFSVGEDCSLCCWDEYDRSERYSFRLKGSGEVVVVETVWSLHSVATGHDDGTFCLWHMDSGTKVASKALRGAPITSIAEGRNKHNDEVIAASDRDGRIAVWNLSLYKMHCLDLPLDGLSNGFHDPDDPGILSLAFHNRTSCFFSGGTDGIIKCWRLHVDLEPRSLEFHNGNSVWNLQVSNRFLVSGDDSGQVSLWLLARVKRDVYTSSTSFPLQMEQLCYWSGAMQGSFQSYCVQQVEFRAYLALADVGGKSSSVWCVTFDDDELQSDRKSEPKAVTSSGAKQKAYENSSSKVSTTAEAGNKSSTSDADGTAVSEGKDSADDKADEKSTILPRLPQYVSLSPTVAYGGDIFARELANMVTVHTVPETIAPQPHVSLLRVVNHENLEPSCMELRLSRPAGAAPTKHTKRDAELYIGMANGVILKHSLGALP